MGYYVKEYDATLWLRAEERASSMPVYAGSHRGKAANQVGALGELVFEDFLEGKGIPFVQCYETRQDLVVLGDTIDVKTKDRTVRMQPNFECSVPLYNHHHQRPSRYVFVSLLRKKTGNQDAINRFTRAYLVGWCTFDHLHARGVLREPGFTDTNGTTFWTGCINIAAKNLAPMDALLSDYQRLSI